MRTGALAGEQRIRYGDDVDPIPACAFSLIGVCRAWPSMWNPMDACWWMRRRDATRDEVLAAVRKRSRWISRHVEAATCTAWRLHSRASTSAASRCCTWGAAIG